MTVCGHALPQGRDTTPVASFEPAREAERCKLRERTVTQNIHLLEYPLGITQFLSPYIYPSTCQKNPGCDTSLGTKKERGSK